MQMMIPGSMDKRALKEGETKCSNCGCIFKFDDHDFLGQSFRQSYSTTRMFGYVYCPWCDRIVDVDVRTTYIPEEFL